MTTRRGKAPDSVAIVNGGQEEMVKEEIEVVAPKRNKNAYNGYQKRRGDTCPE